LEGSVKKFIGSVGFVIVAAAMVTSMSAQNTPPAVGAQPEVTAPSGRAFYALPDSQGTVLKAGQDLSADPRNPDLLLKLAQAQAAIWQYREAVATCGRALRISPEKASLYLERGHRELALMQFAEAGADLDRAVAFDPKLMDSYYHLGLSHYFQGEFAQAADAFQHSVDGAQKPEDLINSTNWLYASLRRAGKSADATKALARIAPEVTTADAHSKFYLNLIRVFQGAMKEEDALPPVPPADGSNIEAELVYDTVSYGLGNWHLYRGETAKAQEYFRKVVEGNCWVTWGFVGSEVELNRMK
jgi:tetratricopeptide (TPR) repeat protein